MILVTTCYEVVIIHPYSASHQFWTVPYEMVVTFEGAWYKFGAVGKRVSPHQQAKWQM